MAQKNAINNSGPELTIDPGASGDSFVQFDINATGEFRVGVDDDASDAFKIAQGSALGTTDTVVVSAAGEVNLPLTPAFFAYNSATDDNVTGDGTVFTVIFNTEVYDQNSDFDATSTFTAPVTGRYLFNSTVLLDGVTTSNTPVHFELDGSNRNLLGVNWAGGILVVGTQMTVEFSGILDMDATDTAVMKVTLSAATLVVDVVGDATPSTWFAGHLIA